MTDPIAVDKASVAYLADVPVDEVIATMDIIDRGVTYRDLYYRWERLNWRVEELDFSQDRAQWREMPPEQRSRLLFTLNNFYHGEDVVAETLAPYIRAAPGVEQKIFLTTQLVDESRHLVFFDRFYAEVVDAAGADLRERLAASRPNLPPGFEELFYKDLTEVSERIAREPESLEALADGVMLYHLVLEGALALTGQRFVLAWLRQQDLLPAFRAGFTAVTRDESRHVIFGTMLLRDLVEIHPDLAQVVTDRLVRSIPAAAMVQQPRDGDLRYTKFFDFRLRDQFIFALNALARRMRGVGLPMPKMPPYRLPHPAGLSKADLMRRIDERAAADQAWTPRKALAEVEGLTPEMVMQLLPAVFDREASKGVEAVYETVLEGEGAATWHVVVRDDSCEVVPGPSPAPPDVRYRMDADVWLRISKDDLDGSEAFVLGLVELTGDLELSSRFDDIFP